MGGSNNDTGCNTKVYQECEHRLSRLEYAMFDERRGVVKSLDEGSDSFQRLQQRIEEVEKLSVTKNIYLRVLVSVGTVIVILVELYQGFLALK